MSESDDQPPVVTEDQWLYVPVKHVDEKEFSLNMILTLASALELSPDELPPLAESIDPDILDRLFARSQAGGSQVEEMQFQYQDRWIRIDSKSNNHFTILQVESQSSDGVDADF